MKKLENEVLLSRRAALGAFATVALGTASLLAGCGSDKTTVTEDAGDADKKEESKRKSSLRPTWPSARLLPRLPVFPLLSIPCRPGLLILTVRP